MRFWKKREKDGESAMWRYAKYAVVAVCVIGIGANSISVIPTGYTGVKSTFGKISEKELTTGIHISVPFVQHIQTISNKQQDRRCEGKIWGETSDKTPVYGENVTVTYSISPEKSAWLCANVTDTDNLIKESIRNVELYKYNKKISYCYEEYDGSWYLCDEAKEMEAYKKDIKKNEKTLPVSMPINSYMWTGDKFSTWYSGVYEIAIEDDMTKEYAKDLAKKFAK